MFHKVEANLLKSKVMAGSAFAKENRCDFIDTFLFILIDCLHIVYIEFTLSL